MEDNNDIEITSIEKEVGGFVITFTNTGDTYLRGIQFNITVTGGWILPVDFHYDEQLFDCNCTDVMVPGDTLMISTNDFDMFTSFGFLDVNVEVSSYATGSRQAEQQAFIIGTFIFLL
jgi:archaellum component FlaF (FlaF/FlaG flagellin family)